MKRRGVAKSSNGVDDDDDDDHPTPERNLPTALFAPGSAPTHQQGPFPPYQQLAPPGLSQQLMGAEAMSLLGLQRRMATPYFGEVLSPWLLHHQVLERGRQLLAAQIALQQEQQKQAVLSTLAALPLMASNLPASTTGFQQLGTAAIEVPGMSVVATAPLMDAGQVAHAIKSERHSTATPTATDAVIESESSSYFDASRLPYQSSDDDDDDDDDDDEDCDDRLEEGSLSEVTGESSSWKSEKFPLKLYRMLEESEKNGSDGIVSFFSHGRAFIIHKPNDFVTELMPKYFGTNRLPSFQRQLNFYNFRRITGGRDQGGYYHEYFLRGRKDLCKKIRRRTAAGIRIKNPKRTISSGAVGATSYRKSSHSTEPTAESNQEIALQRHQFSGSMENDSTAATRLDALTLPKSLGRADLAMKGSQNSWPGTSNVAYTVGDERKVAPLDQQEHPNTFQQLRLAHGHANDKSQTSDRSIERHGDSCDDDDSS